MLAASLIQRHFFAFSIRQLTAFEVVTVVQGSPSWKPKVRSLAATKTGLAL